ncbi:MAG: GNAT family N-acetyltransferase [Ferruginibacter sp.]
MITWKFAAFNELTVDELYAIITLRNEVFVVEQNCVYQDADNKDQISFHLSGWHNDELIAYCRILPPGISYEEASIGRVVTSPAYRNTGSGKELMKMAIEKTLQQFNCKTIVISAQLYLNKFYTALSFVQIGEPYLEDNIPHIKMRLTA